MRSQVQINAPIGTSELLMIVIQFNLSGPTGSHYEAAATGLK